eukprot:355105-Chlamydomonas_euryale.AAC.6
MNATRGAWIKCAARRGAARPSRTEAAHMHEGPSVPVVKRRHALARQRGRSSAAIWSRGAACKQHGVWTM